MSYLNIESNINTKLDVIGELNKKDIIGELNERDIFNEFSNKRTTTVFNGSTKNYYEFIGYTVLSLLAGGFKKTNYINSGFTITQLINGNFNRDNFITAGYSIKDILYAGFKIKLKLLGYTVLELYNEGFQKSDFDFVGYSVYDVLDVLPGDEVYKLGYSYQLINTYRTFIFQISTLSWNSSLNQRKRYPINNILYSFQDLSINEVSISGTTTVTINWNTCMCNNDSSCYPTFNDCRSSDNGYFDQSNNGFFDSHTNDGLSLNTYTIPYYNDPTFRILQFGGIPFARNSAINTNYFQGYQFGGSIDASFDTPRFLSNTSFYNAFANSTANSSNNNFQNISSWNTINITDLRGAFQGATKFHERIGQWNFSQIKGTYMENIISGTGYNPIEISIFLQDLSSNLTLQNNISLGKIPNYFINNKTTVAIRALSNKKIRFDASGIVPNPSSFLQSGYSISEARIAGFTALDLSNISSDPITTLNTLFSSGYTIREIDTIRRYSLSNYIDDKIPLKSLIDSNYTALQLEPYKNIQGYGVIDYKNNNYVKSDISGSFTLLQLLNAGYSLTQLNKIGYSVGEIYPIINSTPPFNLHLDSSYNILKFTSAGFSLTYISNNSNVYPQLSLSNLSKYSYNDLSNSYIFASSLKNIGYSISKIFGLGYQLIDLYIN